MPCADLVCPQPLRRGPGALATPPVASFSPQWWLRCGGGALRRALGLPRRPRLRREVRGVGGWGECPASLSPRGRRCGLPVGLALRRARLRGGAMQPQFFFLSPSPLPAAKPPAWPRGTSHPFSSFASP
ncbi:uncharacterized protein Tco025E_10019, partial [Trypanosoma conorhini]